MPPFDSWCLNGHNKKQWTLTYGETTPYVWCVYVNGIPEKRFIRREETIHYLEEISKENNNGRPSNTT